MFCRHCGKGIPEDSRFCPNCGTKINSVETVKPPKTREKQVQKAKECCVCGSKDIGSFGTNFSRDGDVALCGLHYRLYQELSKKAAGMAAARTGERFSPVDYPRCGVNEAEVILTAIGIAQDSKRGKESAAS